MNYLNIFLNEANKYPEFKEAKEIVKKNSEGNVWLIGGFIYRNIVAGLYGTEKPKIDLDFIIQKPIEKFILPEGWKKIKNHFGNPKFVGPNFEIDFVPLKKIYSIKHRKLYSSIKNYLSGTPLNIQSIVYDFKKNELKGERSFWSIENKFIIPNSNYHLLEFAAIDKNKKVDEYIIDMAKSLNFDYILPTKLKNKINWNYPSLD
jgi:hypothetical protein